MAAIQAGIYIHIPYCKTKCNYCDFFSVVNKENEAEFIQALLTEMDLQKHFFSADAQIATIYFGGGTPSFIEKRNIERILDKIKASFTISDEAEITLEANPDDLSAESLSAYKKMGFNRLSMGVQSLIPEQLRFMQRRHTVAQAQQSVENAIAAGFGNISIDLIYGLPDLEIAAWQTSLRTAMKWPVTHISAYHLTVEEDTLLAKQVKSGMVKTIDENLSFTQFELLMDIAAENGFEQYEISNFARDGKYSRHNSAYWQQKPYLGLGPSAHSYNGEYRCWNVRHLNKYIKELNNSVLPKECEKLSAFDKFNDMILTSLRTSVGLDTNSLFEYINPGNRWTKQLHKFLDNGSIIQKNNRYTISRKGIHIADTIMSDLMLIND